MDVMGFRSMEIDGLYDGEWNEGIPEPENPLHLERAYRLSLIHISASDESR